MATAARTQEERDEMQGLLSDHAMRRGSRMLYAALWDQHADILIKRHAAVANDDDEPRRLVLEKIKYPWPAWYVPPQAKFNLQRLIANVARDLDVSRADVLDVGRRGKFVRARVVIAMILRERGWSTPMIGRALGNRDHTTILNLLDRFPYYCEFEEVSACYMRHRCPKPGKLV